MSNWKLRWSRKENDWVVEYPTRNGRILGNIIFDALNKKADEREQPLREIITQAGFDPDTFTITIKQLNPTP